MYTYKWLYFILLNVVSDPSHIDVDPDPGIQHLGIVGPDPDPRIHLRK